MNGSLQATRWGWSTREIARPAVQVTSSITVNRAGSLLTTRASECECIAAGVGREVDAHFVARLIRRPFGVRFEVKFRMGIQGGSGDRR